MILWTPLYLEQVLEGLNEVKPRYEEIEYLGRKIEVERLDGNRLRLIRLISSDPLDYLDNRFQPGQLIDMLP